MKQHTVATVNMERCDGKQFIKDKRGAIPHYVVEDNEEGNSIIVNQFTGDKEVIGGRPYSKNELRRAWLLLHKAGRLEGEK